MILCCNSFFVGRPLNVFPKGVTKLLFLKMDENAWSYFYFYFWINCASFLCPGLCFRPNSRKELYLHSQIPSLLRGRIIIWYWSSHEVLTLLIEWCLFSNTVERRERLGMLFAAVFLGLLLWDLRRKEYFISFAVSLRHGTHLSHHKCFQSYVLCSKKILHQGY